MSVYLGGLLPSSVVSFSYASLWFVWCQGGLLPSSGVVSSSYASLWFVWCQGGLLPSSVVVSSSYASLWFVWCQGGLLPRQEHGRTIPNVREHVRLSQSKGVLNTRRNCWRRKRKEKELTNMVVQGFICGYQNEFSPCFLSSLECLGLVCCCAGLRPNSIPHGFILEPHNIGPIACC